MLLQNKSLIAHFSVSQWTARKLDRKVTKETNERHNAKADAARVTKQLVAKDMIESISTIATQARDYHYTVTLPWGKGNGEGLLNVETYPAYIQKMMEFESAFNAAVNNFKRSYSEAIDRAKSELNGMFNPKDYPSLSEIESKYSFSVKFYPVPENDFRVTLDKDIVEKLKKDMGIEMNSRVSEAIKDIWKRIRERLTNMRDQLSKSKGKIYDSLFENLNDLIEIIPSLNVTNDPDIAKVCEEMKGLAVTADEVRNNNRLRSKKAAEVQQVLNRFDGFFR